MLVGLKIGTDGSRSTWSDILDRFKRFNTQLKIQDILNTMKQWGKKFRCTLPDSWDSESTDKSIDGKCPLVFYGSQEIVD